MHRVLLLASVLILTAAIAACGGDDEAAAPTPPPDTATPEATPPPGEQETDMDADDPGDTADDTATAPGNGFGEHRVLPADYPIYPGATFLLDTPLTLDNAHGWMFTITDSSREFCQIWLARLQQVGFDVESDFVGVEDPCEFDRDHHEIVASRGGERATALTWTFFEDDGQETINVIIYWDNWDDAWLH